MNPSSASTDRPVVCSSSVSSSVASAAVVTSSVASPMAARPPAARARGIKQPKARHAADCIRLEQLPNIGPSLAADLRSIGIHDPQQLRGEDAYALYRSLCSASGQRQDPCVLDTFMAATDFMNGAPPAPWWHYTAQRKATFGPV